MKFRVNKLNTAVTTEIESTRNLTVREALEQANVSPDNSHLYRVRRGTSTNDVTLNSYLEDGDLVQVIPRVKGGSTIEVTVLRLNQPKKIVTLNSGASASDAVRASGLDSSGTKPQRRGEILNGDEQVYDGDLLTLIPKVAGGN